MGIASRIADIVARFRHGPIDDTPRRISLKRVLGAITSIALIVGVVIGMSLANDGPGPQGVVVEFEEPEDLTEAAATPAYIPPSGQAQTVAVADPTPLPAPTVMVFPADAYENIAELVPVEPTPTPTPRPTPTAAPTVMVFPADAYENLAELVPTPTPPPPPALPTPRSAVAPTPTLPPPPALPSPRATSRPQPGAAQAATCLPDPVVESECVP